MISVHTSPLDQPGVGDAGGMNVYVVELARRLADLGTQVEVFTRATSSRQPAVVEAAPGVLVRHVTAGPYQGLAKQDLPAELCSFTSAVLRAEAVQEPGYYDLLHSHYWLSGHVGWLAKQRWGVPLVHTMHTMAKVKNASLADGDVPEPEERVLGEQQVVRYADRLVANTYDEADQLISLYGADPRAVRVVHPGVDLEVFTPGDRLAARRRLDLPTDADVLLFAGRIQPLKGPDILVRATAELLARQPELRARLLVPVVGGPSGGGMGSPQALADMARSLGVADVMRFEPPVERGRLADWYRAASLVVVPSHSESFGLVAIEAQACATPVVAADVAGLRTAVLDGRSGVLVAGHDPADYARVLADLLAQPARREELARGALHHASEFGWAATAESTLAVYCEALADLSIAKGELSNDTVARFWRPSLRVASLAAP